LRAREELAGWLWTSPWLLGFFLFVFGPMVASLYLSFTKYAIGGTPQFLGLDNFVRALSGKDDLFWPSMGRTVEYAVVMVPIGAFLDPGGRGRGDLALAVSTGLRRHQLAALGDGC
jgi:multiple sugar transport system permease protein